MPTILITGANRGIGLELTRQYAAEGWDVIATCRKPEAATDLATLAEGQSSIEVHALDVTDESAVRALSEELKDRAIDVLFNNAGVLSTRGPDAQRQHVAFGDSDYDEWVRVFRVNALGAMIVSEAFVEHVAASDQKKIVATTSRMGSITENGGGYYSYRSTKAALNSIMRGLSRDLAGRGISVAVYHPGWVQTDMGGPSATVPVAESAAGLRARVAELSLETSGRFRNFDGAEIPW